MPWMMLKTCRTQNVELLRKLGSTGRDAEAVGSGSRGLRKKSVAVIKIAMAQARQRRAVRKP